MVKKNPSVKAKKRAAKRKPAGWEKFVRDAVIVVGAYVLIRLLVLEANVIPSGSMKDTLLVGDYIFAEKVTYHFRDPRPGEIVTFIYPFRDMPATQAVRFFLRNFLGESKTGPRLLIKRVQGAPGDTLELKGGDLYRNGKKVEEPYLKEDAGEDWGPYVVPPGYYFLMGDNRYDSADSRFIGPCPRRFITAQSFAIYFSLAPVNCDKHNAPVLDSPEGWRCSAGGEIKRVGWDFQPTLPVRLDQRVRWSRMGKLTSMIR